VTRQTTMARYAKPRQAQPRQGKPLLVGSVVIQQPVQADCRCLQLELVGVQANQLQRPTPGGRWERGARMAAQTHEK
jgi:hypothetical protein